MILDCRAIDRPSRTLDMQSPVKPWKQRVQRKQARAWHKAHERMIEYWEVLNIHERNMHRESIATETYGKKVSLICREFGGFIDASEGRSILHDAACGTGTASSLILPFFGFHELCLSDGSQAMLEEFDKRLKVMKIPEGAGFGEVVWNNLLLQEETGQLIRRRNGEMRDNKGVLQNIKLRYEGGDELSPARVNAWIEALKGRNRELDRGVKNLKSHLESNADKINYALFHCPWQNLAEMVKGLEVGVVAVLGNSLPYAGSWAASLLDKGEFAAFAIAELKKALDNFYAIIRNGGALLFDLYKEDERPHEKNLGATSPFYKKRAMYTWKVGHDMENRIRHWDLTEYQCYGRLGEDTFRSVGLLLPHSVIFQMMLDAGFSAVIRLPAPLQLEPGYYDTFVAVKGPAPKNLQSIDKFLGENETPAGLWLAGDPRSP